MEFEGKYNPKSTAVKRLMREAIELNDANEEFYAHPLEDNLFEWHFTVQGPTNTEFEGGFYHGRILLPTEYPMKPPNIILLTPNGRFETNKKICLSISGHHPETWQPSWSIRTALLALIAFMPTPGKGTIGSLDFSPEERKSLANKSRLWECHICGKISDQLSKTSSIVVTSTESDLIRSVVFKGEEPLNEKADVVAENGVNDSNKEFEQVLSVEENNLGINNGIPLHTSVESTDISMHSYRDSLLNVSMGIIVVVISFLIYRRLFLL